MAENSPNQGGQGGSSPQYVDADTAAKMAELAALRAIEAQKAATAQEPDERPVRRRKRQEEYDDEDDEIVGFSPKLVKQLQTTVSVFNTLKEFGSSPLQKAIESKVGDMAAGVIEQAFSRPSGPPPKRDIIETFLNSQMAYGLGQGLGQRAPELVESLGRTFGQQRAEEMIDGVIGKYGSEQGGRQRQIAPGPSERSHSPAPAPEQKADKTSEQELLLSLDPNNPEHVAAYAETQGGISIDVARKMLMIHQDDFIKQMQMKGVDTQEISKLRGSQQNPVQQETFVQQPTQQPVPPPIVQQPAPSPIVQPIQPVPPRSVPSPIIQPTQQQPISPSIHSPQTNDPIQPSIEYFDDRVPQGQDQKPEYAEYDEVIQPEKGQGTISTPEHTPVQDNQQMMKMFADDIGKIMGDMINKIESMNNTIFTLQNDVNTIKKGGIPVAQPAQPTISSPIPPSQAQVSPKVPKVPDMVIVEQPARKPLDIKRSEDFFEEQIQDTSDFLRELEEETKTKKEEIKPPVQQPESAQPVQQPEPIIQSAQQPIPSPMIQLQPIPSPMIQLQPIPSPMIQLQPIPSPMIQPAQPILSSTTQTNSNVSLMQPENILKVEKAEDILKVEKAEDILKVEKAEDILNSEEMKERSKIEQERINEEQRIEEENVVKGEKVDRKIEEKYEEKIDKIEEKKEEKKKEKKFVTPIKKDGINKKLIPLIRKTEDSSLKEDKDKAI